MNNYSHNIYKDKSLVKITDAYTVKLLFVSL